MKKMILFAIASMTMAAHATSVPVELSCKGKDSKGHEVTLDTRTGPASYTRAPYYYQKTHMITVSVDGEDSVLLAQNVDADKDIGVLHVSGMILPNSYGFDLMANLKTGTASIQADGVIVGKVNLRCN